MKKKLSTPLYLGLAVICLSSFVEDAKEKCAKEAADFVQMAVSDGHSWKYAMTVGNMVYEECIAKEQKPKLSIQD